MANIPGLADVTIEVNDEVVEIKANSLEIRDGFGNMTARSQTSGGNITIVTTEDAETKIGMVKFTLLSEVRNAALKSKWLRISRESGGNGIRISGPGFTRSFRGMIIKDEPTLGIGVEGEMEIEFCGEAAA